MNRRMRNRMSGGVGGRQGRPCLLPDRIRALAVQRLVLMAAVVRAFVGYFFLVLKERRLHPRRRLRQP